VGDDVALSLKTGKSRERTAHKFFELMAVVAPLSDWFVVLLCGETMLKL